MSAELIEPQWFIPTLAGMWLAICLLLSHLGGWSSLVPNFRSNQPVLGTRTRFVSGSMGHRLLPVSYGNCLFVTVNEEGIGLSILFLFRVFSPPLFIPWSEVESVEQKKAFFASSVAMRVRGHWPTVSIRGTAGKNIDREFAKFRSNYVRQKNAL
jgi:hypothetical protein